MKYFPNWIAKWKRDGLAWHKAETEMFEGFNAGVAQKLVSSLLNRLVPFIHEIGL